MTRQSRFWKPIHFYLVEKVLSIIAFKRFHVTKTPGLRRVDPFWEPFQRGLLLAKSRDRNQCSGVILLAGTRSRPKIGGANCVPQLPPLRIYVNTTYQRYILWGSGHFTSTCFLLDEDTLWQPTRMGRTFGDKKNGLVIADCLAKDR